MGHVGVEWGESCRGGWGGSCNGGMGWGGSYRGWGGVWEILLNNLIRNNKIIMIIIFIFKTHILNPFKK